MKPAAAYLILAASMWALAATAVKPGKLAPRPLYRDPVYDTPTDPALCYNAEQKKWLMFYTQRRGNGISLIHGTRIGVAESADGGATWTYRGLAAIDYGADKYPDGYTYWAPDVIWFKGIYHMYLTFVPGVFTNWDHPREIVHLTSRDMLKWTAVGPLDLGTDRAIDAGLIQLRNGVWRMFFKDERKKMMLSYADSPDLYQWQAKGNAVTDRNGEGPKPFHWKGKYWLVADIWAGQGVWNSDDCTHWKPQQGVLPGNHGDVVVSGGRAYFFFFGPAQRSSRTVPINVVELNVVNGKLVPQDLSEPTYIDLKPQRETEK